MGIPTGTRVDAAQSGAPSPAGLRWLWTTGLVLCGVGFGVAGYLTYEHYTASTSLSCPAGGGIVNCFKVTTSSYSKIAGVPVAVLGLVFFAVMAVFQSQPAWRSPRPLVRVSRLFWALVGIGTAVWLIYAELFNLDAICLWCTSVHLISLLLFALTAFGTAMTTAIDIEGDDADAHPSTGGAPASTR